MGEVVESGIGNGEQTDVQSGRGAALNQVMLLGRLTMDPNVRFTPSGKGVTEFRLATNERAQPEFHDVVTYGRLAEVVGEFMRKGSLVLVQGHLHGRSWKAQDGTPRRRVEITAERVQFLDRVAQAS
jgi:single-strand DNA-binding protein